MNADKELKRHEKKNIKVEKQVVLNSAYVRKSIICITWSICMTWSIWVERLFECWKIIILSYIIFYYFNKQLTEDCFKITCCDGDEAVDIILNLIFIHILIKQIIVFI